MKENAEGLRLKAELKPQTRKRATTADILGTSQHKSHPSHNVPSRPLTFRELPQFSEACAVHSEHNKP